jgi:spatacsin
VSGLPTADTLVYRDFDFFMHSDENTELNAVYWEATIQKHVQEELFDSSLEVYLYISTHTHTHTHMYIDFTSIK